MAKMAYQHQWRKMASIISKMAGENANESQQLENNGMAKMA